MRGPWGDEVRKSWVAAGRGLDLLWMCQEGIVKSEAGAGLASDIMFVLFCRDEQDVIPIPRKRLPGGGESPEL